VESWSRSPRALTLVGIAIAACGLVGAASGLGAELRDDRGTLYSAAVTDRVAVPRLRSLARAAMSRHPAEPYLPFIVGWRAGTSGDADALPWIEATLERANVYGPAHLMLARLLAKRSPPQARLEYRLATEQGAPLMAAAELARLVSNLDDALEIVPQGPAGVPILEGLVDALPARLPATCARLDEELLARAPADPGPSLRAAACAVEDLQVKEGAPWCDGGARQGCIRRALDASLRAERIAPAVCEPYVLEARTRISAGDAARALAGLAEAASVTTEHIQCLQALATLADDVHDERHATEALNKIAASGCAGDDECAANLAWVAAREERRGNTRRALAFYQRAYARLEDDSLLESVARVAASAGLHMEAADSYARLARKHPDQGSWEQAAAAERDAALGAATGL
jgi:tetratricopeptide (TPR) repeat protein